MFCFSLEKKNRKEEGREGFFLTLNHTYNEQTETVQEYNWDILIASNFWDILIASNLSVCEQ